LNIHLTPADAPAVFSDIHLGLTARFQVETIGFLSQQIRSIEKAVLPQVSLRPEFEILLKAFRYQEKGRGQPQKRQSLSVVGLCRGGQPL
jgi:hypothetical protein